MNSLRCVPNLYEIDLSENKAIQLSDFLKEARDVCCNLETVVFTDNQNMSLYSCDAVLNQEVNGLA